MITIGAKVGNGGTNRPVDVMIIQHLLNLNPVDAGLDGYLQVTGDMGTAELKAIRAFQASRGAKNPDGRVDPGGKTLAALAAPVASSTTLKQLRSILKASSETAGARPGEASSALGIIDATRFSARYDRQIRQLGASARQGMAWLLDFINKDMTIVDVGHAAYMLATVKIECANTWKPIEEYGKGAGHTYGNAVTVTDPAGKQYTNTYYGRGYVQITWQANYQKLGRALGLGDDLMYDPKIALDPEVAYAIASYGMRHGSFTGKRLSKFINATQCDYVNARTIINGHNNAAMIADFAEQIELLLRVSCN